MNIVELKDIVREEGQIFYFRKYTAIAVIELPTETISTRIAFEIETGPLGDKNITLKVLDTPNYPVLPIISDLKKYILEQDKEGFLL